MIKVRLNGGLGNQLFQYAFAYSLVKSGYDVTLDASGFNMDAAHGGLELDEYDIKLAVSNRLSLMERLKFELVARSQCLAKIFKGVIIERSYAFDKQMMRPPANSLIAGYFQSEKYFKHHRDELIQEFRLPKNLRSSIYNQINVIKQYPGITSVHIRRGDYLLYPEIYQVCDKDYFLRAIALINDKYPDTKFLFFSDDMSWVKKNFSHSNFLFSEDNNSPKQDLYLMSLCSHHILSNSSFSWWGGWLNRKIHKTIIAPIRWYSDDELDQSVSDVVPGDWLRI